MHYVLIILLALLLIWPLSKIIVAILKIAFTVTSGIIGIIGKVLAIIIGLIGAVLLFHLGLIAVILIPIGLIILAFKLKKH